MRFVKNKYIPKLACTEELEQAARDILAVASDNMLRKKFIRDNAAKWTALRHALWGLNGCKCWYSEALIQADQGQIEHFRPKNAVAGEAHSGYWWRAFDWTNFRLAHPTVNVRITDYLTGQLAGKGTYFPLKPGTPRATCAADEVHEEPILLDPTIATDCRLLCFDLSSGKSIPRVAKERDAWLHQRAADSIGYYHLNDGDWNVQRKDLVDDVSRLCNKVESLACKLPDAEFEYEEALGELSDYLGHMAPFSSVAFQVVRERGLLEHLVPVPTQ